MLGLVMLALRTGPVSAGVIDAVLFTTTLALRETMAVMAALAVLDGLDDLLV